MFKTQLVRAWQIGLYLLKEARALFGFLMGFVHSRDQIVFRWDAAPKLPGRRFAVFVHFDRNGRVNAFVRDYVQALRDAGCEVIFVTNAGELQPTALALLQPMCRTIIVRRNVGYDFAAMRDGLAAVPVAPDALDFVLIANDSVYGPFTPLGPVLARMDFTKADVWGATESWQRRYHLQSFFLAAGPAALSSKAWREFWGKLRPVRSKHWIVTRYEVGLTQALVRAGLRCQALWGYEDLAADVDTSLLGPDETVVDPFENVRRIQAGRIRYATVARRPLNPTAELWRQLLVRDFPFIKRELLRDNPAGISDIIDWRNVLRRQFGTDTGPIEADLRRVLKNQSP